MNATVHIDVLNRRENVVKLAAQLATEKFLARADRYDESASFPSEDFDDLFAAGLHTVAVPMQYGGMGYGPYQNDVHTLWMVTKELAKVDLSLARCWEGHVNSLVLIDGLANETQKARWFSAVVNQGDKWASWSGEPQLRTQDQKTSIGTYVSRVQGGYVVDGSKAFCTSAGSAEMAILLVNSAGPGGARHASQGAREDVLMLACDLSDPSVSFDDAWWNPIGMRGTVSHLARFKQTFIPEENLIGQPGDYLAGGWQTCFTPHYAASFLGAAEGVYSFARTLLSDRDRAADPYVQQHVGQMSVNVESGRLWLRRVADLWDSHRYDEARLAGLRARHVIEQLADDTVRRCISACGARCLNRPSLVERVYRDLSFYFRHDNADHILATIGRAELAQDYDVSFFNATK